MCKKHSKLDPSIPATFPDVINSPPREHTQRGRRGGKENALQKREENKTKKRLEYHLSHRKPGMKKTLAVPDAWDDDWETQADDAAAVRDDATTPVQEHQNQQPLTKAERLMQHAEANRKLWKSADEPQTFHYLEASNNVPLTSAFKPQVKVLSRKPTVAKDPVVGLGPRLSSSAAADDDDDDDDTKTTPLNPEQIRAKQKRDREEKQKRYDEARAKIFGDSAPSSRGTSPVTVTPPRSADGRHHQHLHHLHHHYAGQGRSRGRGGGQRANADVRQQQQQQQQPPEMRRQNSQARELYDPNCSSKPDAPQPRKGPDGDIGKGPSLRDELLQPIRAPRGPDSSGRGGFGFARRGSKEG
ncbi:hypothetical protein L249_6807 [Ophiocordyceps polyrhachis-furcata BCC 54312]|uniref:Uncharacterized protein n=1 Tax=Ophiocordyceps polyrhachis-furcata BCC 54312 TaxID=1330021 RepID=A0A367LKV2_9HYPO|nr:hypothetical protein L249_6807 [Ophiocordyceps polyrhachis-furcata BCC 54312]